MKLIFKMAKARICPKCESTRVKLRNNILLVVGAPQEWVCENCGFSAYLFPELNLEDAE